MCSFEPRCDRHARPPASADTPGRAGGALRVPGDRAVRAPAIASLLRGSGYRVRRAPEGRGSACELRRQAQASPRQPPIGGCLGRLGQQGDRLHRGARPRRIESIVVLKGVNALLQQQLGLRRQLLIVRSAAARSRCLSLPLWPRLQLRRVALGDPRTAWIAPGRSRSPAARRGRRCFSRPFASRNARSGLAIWRARRIRFGRTASAGAHRRAAPGRACAARARGSPPTGPTRRQSTFRPQHQHRRGELELRCDHVRVSAMGRKLAVVPDRPAGAAELARDPLRRGGVGSCVRQEDVGHARSPVCRLLSLAKRPGEARLASMAKPKSRYVCQACGSVSTAGRANAPIAPSGTRWSRRAAEVSSIFAAKHNLQGGGRVIPLVGLETPRRCPSGCRAGSPSSTARSAAASSPGSAMLVGGDPGIGKSTLLLQVAARLASAGQQGRLCLRRGIGRAGAAARGAARARRSAGAARRGDLGARHPDDDGRAASRRRC